MEYMFIDNFISAFIFLSISIIFFLFISKFFIGPPPKDKIVVFYNKKTKKMVKASNKIITRVPNLEENDMVTIDMGLFKEDLTIKLRDSTTIVISTKKEITSLSLYIKNFETFNIQECFSGEIIKLNQDLDEKWLLSDDAGQAINEILKSVYASIGVEIINSSVLKVSKDYTKEDAQNAAEIKNNKKRYISLF